MIEERGTKLNLEEEKEPTKSSEVFYNREMVLNRDISVSCLQVAQKISGKKMTICEPLSGTGIRGLRYEKEVKDIEKIILSDLNPKAVEKIKEHIKINNSRKIEVFNKDANLILAENYKKFDFIDIDPFGSPVYYLNSAARSLKNNGFIAVTATDLAVLCGAYKQTCLRRYHSTPLKTKYCHEIGIRILIKSIIEEFSKYDMAFQPLLSFYKRHYYRIFGKIKESAKHANRLLREIGFLSHCDYCDFRAISSEKIENCPFCGKKLNYAGPLWIGPITNKNFCSKVKKDLEKRQYEEAKEIISLLEKESEIKIPFYETHVLAKKALKDSPKLEKLITKLRNQGYEAEKTHFSSTGFKTNAPIDFIKKSF